MELYLNVIWIQLAYNSWWSSVMVIDRKCPSVQQQKLDETLKG